MFTEDENSVDEQLCVYEYMTARAPEIVDNDCLCVTARSPEIVDFHKVDGKSASVTVLKVVMISQEVRGVSLSKPRKYEGLIFLGAFPNFDFHDRPW